MNCLLFLHFTHYHCFLFVRAQSFKHLAVFFPPVTVSLLHFIFFILFFVSVYFSLLLWPHYQKTWPNGWSARVHFPWMNTKRWMAWLLLYPLLQPLQSDPPGFLSLTLIGQPNCSLSLPLPHVGLQMGPWRKHTMASGSFWLPWMVSLQVRACC